MEQPARYFSNNIGGTNALLDALQRCGVGAVVFSSTCAVYGTPDHLPVTEDTPVHPESPYGESKLAVERMLAWYDACHGLASMRLRYFNAAGAAADGTIGEDWAMTLNLVPLAMKALLGARPPLEVFGTDYPTRDGTAIRDYIHVEDLADAHVRALEHLTAGGASATLNLGTGTGSTVREVLAAAERAAGRPVPHEEVGRRAGDPVAIWADTSKAAELLGWRATRSLDEIVGSAWAWHSRTAR
jgi:UDP-glucose-4-epimerase GalE